MKRYRFSMSGVLRVRQISEEQARAAYLEAQADAEQASADLEARLEAMTASVPDPGRRSTGDFQEERYQLERHHIAVLAARAAEANALDIAMSNYGDWVEAAREVRALERLDERQHTEWTLEATRNAQLATDEIATTRFRAGEQQR